MKQYNTPSINTSTDTSVTITTAAAAGVGSVELALSGTMQRAFEIVDIAGKMYLIVGTEFIKDDKPHYTIYPALSDAVASGTVLKPVLYNRDQNAAILSTGQNYDIIARVFSITMELNRLFENIISVRLPRAVTAYDLAVREGYPGTLKQWLNSLKGKDGLSVDISGLISESKVDELLIGITKRIDEITEAYPGAATVTELNEILDQRLGGMSLHVPMSQAEYDALTEKDPNRLYIVI